MRQPSVLGVITARGGSKGLPGKNLMMLGGKPMVHWSIQAGQHARHISRLILSSEDPEIISSARDAGCDVPFVRPAELATDTASIYDVLNHAVETIGERYEYVMLLQATSPLRTAGDIDATMRLCLAHDAPAAIAVTPSPKPPQWMYYVNPKKQIEPVLAGENASRRQELPTAMVVNGAVYVARTDWLVERKSFVSADTVAYVMPPERSVDVDSLVDFKIAEFFLAASQSA